MYAKSKSRPKILCFCLKIGECPLTPLIQLNVYWLLYFYQISYKTIVCKQKKVSEDIYLSISLLLFYRSDLRTISSTIAQSMLDDLSIQQQQQQTNQGASLSRIDDNFTSTSSSLASATANASGTRVIKKLR